MRANQRLIDAGVSNWYQHAILLIVTGSGLLYITNTLPAYDPGILATPRWLIFICYFALAVGGLGIYAGFLAAIWDKVLSLKIQFIGLLLQAASISVVAIAVVAFGGVGKSLFILLLAVPITVMHTFRLFSIRREISNAPAKERIAASSFEAEQSETFKGDLVLQTLQFLQLRNEKLMIELGNK